MVSSTVTEEAGVLGSELILITVVGVAILILLIVFALRRRRALK